MSEDKRAFRTDPQLTKLFEECRELYWPRRRALKQYEIGYGYHQRLSPTVEGYCDREQKKLYIVPGGRSLSLRHLVLHEMCHVAYNFHGKRWLREMERIAALEDDAKFWEHIDKYREPADHPARVIANEIDRLLEHWRDAPLEMVQAHLVSFASVDSVDDLLQSYRWIPARYRNKKKELEEVERAEKEARNLLGTPIA